MENTGSPRGPAVVTELSKVARVLRDSDTRKSFTEDWKRALERAGVDMSAIPSSVFDTLSGMSHDELSAIIRFNDALIDAGLYVKGPDVEPEDGRVGFF